MAVSADDIKKLAELSRLALTDEEVEKLRGEDSQGKKAKTAEAKRRGKQVHMGRVNSARRYRYAEAIGCDSADGTYIAFGPDVNLPKVLAWPMDALFTLTHEVAS